MADEFDDALGDAIRARSGGAVQISSARHAVIARATQVRRRRRAAVGGVGALVVIGALFLVPAAGDGQVAPADTPPPTPESVDMETTPPSSVDTTRRTVPSTSVVPSAVPTEPTSGTADTSTTSLADDNPDVTEPTASPTPTTVAVPVPPVTTPSTSSTSSTSSTAAPVGDAPFTQQYPSTGGSITVRWDGSALTLTSVDPADGYTTEIEDQSAARIRVRFRSDDDDSRIEVRVRDGVVEPPIIS